MLCLMLVGPASPRPSELEAGGLPATAACTVEHRQSRPWHESADSKWRACGVTWRWHAWRAILCGLVAATGHVQCKPAVHALLFIPFCFFALMNLREDLRVRSPLLPSPQMHPSQRPPLSHRYGRALEQRRIQSLLSHAARFNDGVTSPLLPPPLSFTFSGTREYPVEK